MKAVYRIIPKAVLMKMLQESDADFILVTCFECDNPIPQTRPIRDGVNLIKKSKTAIFSNTPVMGSIDLFNKEIKNVRVLKACNHNILFPIKST